MTSQNTLPQGFSVYQPALGAQLQFFPAVGTQQLDDMMHAFIPGPASTQEKRATVSLDFLEYTQLTGQSFKFYPVYSIAESPATDSGSSFNVSPVTPSWDWSQASASSRSSAQPRKAHKAASRHQPTDFSHLPGMQIMTKDGRDVTNSASRGSKSKEQRDHAHLMRVIKACEACRRRKTRCDPSHKKRTAQAQAQSPSQTGPKTKKAKMAPAPSIAMDEAPTASPFDFDASFTGFEDLEFSQDWDQFVQYPADLTEDYNLFLDPEGFLSPESSLSSSSSPFKSQSPTSQSLGVSPTEMLNPELQTIAPELPFLDEGGNYVDFNLFSPESSFSEDEFMIPTQASSGLASVTPPLDPRGLPPVHRPFAQDGVTERELQFETHDGGQYYDPGRPPVDTGIDMVSSSPGTAVEMSMRSLLEARSSMNQGHEFVIDHNTSGPSSQLPAQPGLAASEITDVSDLGSTYGGIESLVNVASEFSLVGDEGYDPSVPDVARTTGPTTYIGARAVVSRDPSSGLVGPSTSVDVNEITRPVAATPVANVIANAESASPDGLEVTLRTEPHSTAFAVDAQDLFSPDDVLTVETSRPVGHQTVQVPGHATSEVANDPYGNREVLSDRAVPLQDAVRRLSTTSMAPLSSVVMMLGVFTLILSALDIYGVRALDAIGIFGMSMVTVLSHGLSATSSATTSAVDEKSEAEGEHDDGGLSSGLVATLRSRASHIISSQTKAPLSQSRWRFSVGCI